MGTRHCNYDVKKKLMYTIEDSKFISFQFDKHYGHLFRLDLKNFKSYKGYHRIGPFKNFNAVIGLNGSGKSNLLTAIAFVLGLRMNRSQENLKDFINTTDSNYLVKNRLITGGVRLIFEQNNGREFQFSRMMYRSLNSKIRIIYRINNHITTLKLYHARLKALGITLKPENFFIFQNDVQNVLKKVPEKIAELIDQIVEIYVPKKLYYEKQIKFKNAEEKHLRTFNQMKVLKNNLKHMK